MVSEKLRRYGVVSREDLAGRLPDEERMGKRGFAVTECIQEIPCDPCVAACPFHAISMEDLNAPPIVDFNLCTGCGMCVSRCPGLAIFVIDVSGSTGEDALVTLPYEFSPIPAVGEKVIGLDREGREVCRGEVKRVIPGSTQDGTSTITISVPRGLVMEVRNIKVSSGGNKIKRGGDG